MPEPAPKPVISPNSKPPIFVVLGPTASGKSVLALEVARRCGGEIISVDALKVYRGLDIGTAKPGKDERRQVPHHGLDLIEPNETFSVAQFLDYAQPVIDDLVARKRLPVLDVTAPLYLKALMYGISRGPTPDPALRRKLEAMPLEDLHPQLQRLDPSRAAELHPNDRKRIIRALEFVMLGQKRMSEDAEWGEPRADYRWVLTGIRWPREALYARVIERADKMFNAGWLEEVRKVAELSKTAAEAHGYKRLLSHLRGEITHDQARDLTRKDVKTFARKSMTFFKRFPRVQWLDVSSEEEIHRAAQYLSWELKEMLNAAGMHREMVDLP
ncbi:MAG: tRNA (adenosine(37)-N6)-dimethylallyltransferase MiaA [Planctomycetes bacterium]|nr:tRNA (adenosine(37)-N6)-dimethylallyltransferase MiaA [Planctomycetota bacterium]